MGRGMAGRLPGKGAPVAAATERSPPHPPVPDSFRPGGNRAVGTCSVPVVALPCPGSRPGVRSRTHFFSCLFQRSSEYARVPAAVTRAGPRVRPIVAAAHRRPGGGSRGRGEPRRFRAGVTPVAAIGGSRGNGGPGLGPGCRRRFRIWNCCVRRARRVAGGVVERVRSPVPRAALDGETVAPGGVPGGGGSCGDRRGAWGGHGGLRPRPGLGSPRGFYRVASRAARDGGRARSGAVGDRGTGSAVPGRPGAAPSVRAEDPSGRAGGRAPTREGRWGGRRGCGGGHAALPTAAERARTGGPFPGGAGGPRTRQRRPFRRLSAGRGWTASLRATGRQRPAGGGASCRRWHRGSGGR